MAWVILLVSGAMESGWALALKASDGFSKLWPTVWFFVFLIGSMGGLAIALKTLPVGTSYAAWAGMGAAATAIIAIWMFDETLSVVKVISLVLIVTGIVGLNLPIGER